VLGPFAPNSPARYFGTDWLVETIRAGATEAKNGSNPIGINVSVGAISALNGPGPNEYNPDHDAGMAVDFRLPIQIPASGDGTLSGSEGDAARLVAALEIAAFTGVTIREVRTSNSDIAEAINAGRLSPIAIVDPAFEGGLHVAINPPAPVFVAELPQSEIDDEVVTEDVGNGFESLLNWLQGFLESDFDVAIPGLADLSTDGLASVIDQLGLAGVLTGQNSIASLVSTLTGSGSSLSVADLASTKRRRDSRQFTYRSTEPEPLAISKLTLAKL
jgi:hypothetical protein